VEQGGGIAVRSIPLSEGTGTFFIIPVIDTIPYWIDIRVNTTSFAVEKTLTKDTVPVDVNAVQFGKFVDPKKAARTYANNPTAFHLRAMNMLYEGLKSNATIVIVPSTAVETMQLGSLAGVTAFTLGLDQKQAKKEKESQHTNSSDSEHPIPV
jgi:regulator of protease activity HflC (stomatin/prohibitin superfamily)